MKSLSKPVLTLGAAAVAVTVLAWPANAGPDRLIHISVADVSRPPIAGSSSARSSRTNAPAGRPRRATSCSRQGVEGSRPGQQMGQRHDQADHRPRTLGRVERWSYPDDGYGDCEDYVLLKRRMLMAAGWPREALLITVVRDKKDEGHAVLTVKTDKGDFILDNQNESVLLWSETGYRFVKRQSQADANIWVSLGDPRPATSTAAAAR